MKLYHGGPGGADALREARIAAPSHVHGACWTPQKMTPHEWPYFIDNGAFTGDFDPDDWLALLDQIEVRMPHPPDFVVLPDTYNDALETVEKHRQWASAVLDRGYRPAYVCQPGMPVQQQITLADQLGVHVVFVGGECRWQRANGSEIVRTSHEKDLRVHIGNPGGKDGLLWAFRTGFDSADTTTIIQNGYWHWLEELERLTQDCLNRGVLKKDTRQSGLGEVA